MIGRARLHRRWIGTGLAAALVIAACAAAFWPIEVRHSAPFGFSLTFDRPRAIAVRGGYVTANYDGFNRVDLDLRAYARQPYDLTLHVQPAGEQASDVRTVELSLSAGEIWHDKAVFADPFVSVRFPPIDESAGRRYYVWVEAGPRNRDATWTLWSIKSYSRVPAHEVLAALVETPPEPLGRGPGRVVLILLLVATVGSAAWLIAVLAGPPSGTFNRRTAKSAARSVAGSEG